MRVAKSVYGFAGVLSLVLAGGFTVSAQEVPDVGPHPPQIAMKAMESHIGNVTGHAKDAKSNFRRYCAGCHGEFGRRKRRECAVDRPQASRLHHGHVQVPLDADRHSAHR